MAHGAVADMAAGELVEGEQPRAFGRQDRAQHGDVGDGRRQRLHVDIFGAEDRLRPIDGEVLDRVELFAIGDAATARQAHRRTVDEMRSLDLPQSERRVGRRSDHVEGRRLPLPILIDQRDDVGADLMGIGAKESGPVGVS